MPMIDVYAAAGTFADEHQLAIDLASAVMKVEQVPDISLFRTNTAAFIHPLPAQCLANVDGDSTYVRIQVLTNAGALDRDKQLAVVAQLTASRPPPRGTRHWPANLGAAHRGARRRMGPGRPRQHQPGAGPGCPRAAGRRSDQDRQLTSEPG